MAVDANSSTGPSPFSLILGLSPALVSNISSRLLSRLHSIAFGSLLTHDEITKLSAASSLTPLEIQSVLTLLTTIFREAAFSMKTPQRFRADLVTMTTETKDATNKDDIIGTLTEVWASTGSDVVKRLKAKSITLGGSWVEGVTWDLAVSLASSSVSPVPTCKATIRFLLEEATFPLCLDSDHKKLQDSPSQDLSLAFSFEELLSFYKELEKIQEKMDSLGK